MPETIRWTVLPDGVSAQGKLRLTVLVSPRLTGGTTLNDFAGFLDWPKTLAAYAKALQVEFAPPGGGTGTAVPTEPRTDRYPPPDSTLWQQLFRPDTKVTDPTRPTALAQGVPPTLRSFPSKAVHGQIGNLYQVAVTTTARNRAFPGSGGEGRTEGTPAPPPTWDLPDLFDLLVPLNERIRTLARAVESTYGQLDHLLQGTTGISTDPYRPRCMDRSAPGYQGDSAMLNFAELYRFYDRRPAPAAPGAAAPTPDPPKRPDPDFHGACALLADHPELLRRFGLALDLLVTPPPGLADQWQARVTFTAPQGRLDTDESLRPWTRLRYVAGARCEAYAEDTGPYGRRMLGLGTDAVHVTDLDVDGAAMKFVEFARIVGQTQIGPADPTGPGSVAPDATALPALHGAGITVLYEGRDASLARQMEDDARHTAGVGPGPGPGTAVPAALLDASHLVRGYRVDVGIVDDTTGHITAWHPLCARTGTYALRRPGQAPVPLTVAPDEGHVKASAVTQDEVHADQFYVHQALFGWHGWSLAAPPPGRTIGLDDRPQISDPEVSADFPLDARFRPTTGTLPALRYRRTYRLRARLTDLAGNSLGPDTDPAGAEGTMTAPLTYSRWEPVPPPVVVPRWPFLEGESEPRLVVRSTVEDDGTPVSPVLWALRRNAEVPDHEQHSPADGLDRRYRPFDERHISPPKTALQMAEQHGMYDAAFGPGTSAGARHQYFASASREAGTYLDTLVSFPENPSLTRDLKFFGEIHVAKHDPHDTEPLTELPVPRGDGLKQGEYVVHDAAQLLLPYLPDVPARGVSFRGLPGADPNETYDFPGPWPQAQPLRLRIEEGTGRPDWPLLGRQLTVYLPKAEVATVRMSCRIDAADLDVFRAWQLLTGSPLWNDPVTGLPQQKKDELTAASAAGENWMITPWVELTLVHAVEKPLERPVLSDLTFLRAAEETFTDLVGSVTSHAKSTGRIDVDATWTEWSDDITQDAPEQVTGHAHAGDLTLQPWQDQHSLAGIRHEFRDTRHRNITYTPTATTRFREYFHPAITDRPELITRTGPAGAGPTGGGWPVPSSRRPEPPVVSHLVPTFRWESSVDHGQHRVTRIRRRAGVRVYLERPWFSSGDDELLALVLDPGTDLPDELVTRCAADPVGADATVLPHLTPANFPNATLSATNVPTAELVAGAPASVTVVAFAPVFDQRQRLWYCDIDVDLGQSADDTAHFPYLRPALARYQPYSVAPLHLSKVVLGEFGQLVPDRTVGAAMTASGQFRIELSGPATVNAVGKRAGAGQPGMAASRRVVASVQQRPPAGGDLDWTDTGAALELTCVARGTGFAWTGDLTPPAPQLPQLSSFRLRIEEYETYLTDRTTATGTVTAGGTALPVGHRLVHADHFALATTLLGRIVLQE
ncbi:hypothetical protein AB0H17_16210 [Streptomyces olivoreticuli]